MSRLAEGVLARFYEAAAAEHAAAGARAGLVDTDVRFADRTVRLTFAGRELADALRPALAPRIVPPSPLVDVSIRLWQEADLDGRAQPRPWRDVDLGPRGLVLGDPSDGVVVVHEEGSGAVTVVDRQAQNLLYRVPSAKQLPWWERAAPLRPAFFWALTGPGRHLVHAGAVGDPERGGTLLAGSGGSGKTTLALAALISGLRYVADDYLLLVADPSPVAWNVYSTAKLDEGHLVRFPELRSGVRLSESPEPQEKSVLDVAPQALVESLPLRSVIIPRITGGRTSVKPASAAEALLALAPSTVFQMPFDDGAAMGSLARLVRGLPCFSLRVGDDRQELALELDRVLDVAADRTSAGVPR